MYTYTFYHISFIKNRFMPTKAQKLKHVSRFLY